MKKIVIMLAVIAMVMGMLAGCGEKTAISIKDIDWSVTEGIADGQRLVGFKYTNNSAYTITYLQIRMRPKQGVTKDDLASFDYEEWMGDDYEVEDIFMDGICDNAVNPGETSKDGWFGRNNIFYVRNIDEYKNVEPDMMTIRYADENSDEHTMYYDYHAHKYFEDSAE